MNEYSDAGSIVRASIMAEIQAEQSNAVLQKTLTAGEDVSQRHAKASAYNLFVPIKGDRNLVYNTLTGAFAIWNAKDMEIYQSIETQKRSVTDPELSDFITGGYMVSNKTDEVLELESRYMAARNDPATMIMTIAPIMACNFACDYCFQGADKPHEKMPQFVQDALLEYLDRKLPELNLLHIAWYGGEPLMGLSTIETLTQKIVALCKKHNTRYSAFIVTNGYFFDGKTAEKLYSLGVTSCQVTFDGAAETHDQRRMLLSGRPTYMRIADNLAEAIERTPIQVSLRVNIDHHNKDNIIDLINDLHKRGFSNRNNLGMYFAPVESITEACHNCNDISMGKQEYASIEAELYRYAFEKGLTGLPRPPVMHGNCAAVRKNGLVLLPNGELHKCWDTVNDTTMKIGTIFEPEKSLDSPVHNEWMQWSPFMNETCRSCKILPNCTGACAYKFIYTDKTLGEGGSLPCPSWKFNINERLLIRAEKRGIISANDILDVSRTTTEEVGRNHTDSGLFTTKSAVAAG